MYVCHLSLLVFSVHLLLGSNISSSDIETADKMLDSFYTLMPVLYSPSQCTPNVHYLRHICHYVRLWGPLWGPLWGYSMFGYENMNGYIKKEFHGNGKVLNQLVFNVQMRQSLPFLQNILCKTETPQTIGLLKSLSSQHQHQNMTPVGMNIYFLGRLLRKSLKESEKRAIEIYTGTLLTSDTIMVAARMMSKHVIFHSQKHVTPTKCYKQLRLLF